MSILRPGYGNVASNLKDLGEGHYDEEMLMATGLSMEGLRMDFFYKTDQ